MSETQPEKMPERKISKEEITEVLADSTLGEARIKSLVTQYFSQKEREVDEIESPQRLIDLHEEMADVACAASMLKRARDLYESAAKDAEVFGDEDRAHELKIKALELSKQIQ